MRVFILSPLPGEWWGADENCVVTQNLTDKSFLKLPACNDYLNVTTNCTRLQSSSTQYWEKYVLNITDGLKDFGDIGGFKYDLPLALLLSWIVVFLCLMKGVKSSGKVRGKKELQRNAGNGMEWNGMLGGLSARFLLQKCERE